MPTFRGSRARLRAELAKIPAVLAGARPDPHGLRALFFGFVGNAVLELVSAAFRVKMAGGVGSDGVSWPPPAPATLADRHRRGVTHDLTLVDSEALVASLEPGTGAEPSGAPGQVFAVGPGSVTVGTAVPYADHHQYGTDRMPPRAVVPPDGELPPAWAPAVEDAMRRGFEAVVERVCALGSAG